MAWTNNDKTPKIKCDGELVDFFKNLNDEEEKIHRKWARDNFNPATDTYIHKIGLWHPVVIDECIQMKIDFNNPNNH